MKRFVRALPGLLIFVQLSAAQTDSSVQPALTPKSADEVKSLIAGVYERNEIASIDVPYHFFATFETLSADGRPDGEGSIERWASSSRLMKTVTRFRGHTMTEYFANAPSHYTDDGFSGSIMSYFASIALFYAAFSPGAILQRDVAVSATPLQGDELDCGSFAMVIGPANYPPLPRDSFCVSRISGNLVLRQTEGISIRYRDFQPFLDKSIARTISASKNAHVRFRIKIEELDQTTPGDAEIAAPPDASSTSPQANIWATKPEETTPMSATKVTPQQELKADHVSGQVVLHALISRTGDVNDVEIIYSTTPELAAYAAEIVKGRHYKPILRDGKPIEDISYAWFTFKF